MTERHPSTGWVCQRLGDRRRLGRVVSSDGDRLTVEFDDGSVTWDGLPPSAQLVDEGSLTLRSLTQPAELLREYERSPYDLVAVLLAETSEPMTARSIQSELTSLGLVAPGDGPQEWKRLQRGLRDHPHINVTSDKPARYEYSVQPIDPRPKAEALDAASVLEALSGSVTPERREKLLGDWERVMSATSLTPTQQQWAALLEVPGPLAAPIQWELLDADELRRRGLELFVKRAVAEGLVYEALRLAVWGRPSSIVSTARRIFRNVAASSLDEAAGQMLSGLARALPSRTEDALRRADPKRLDRLSALLPRRRGPGFVAGAVELAYFAHAGASDSLVRVRTWALSQLDDPAVSVATLQAALGQLDRAVLTIDAFARSLRDRPLVQSGVRIKTLSALAALGSEALADPAMWGEMTIADLTTVGTDHRLRNSLGDDPLLTIVTKPALQRALSTGDPAEMLAIVGAPDWLTKAVDRDRFLVVWKRLAERVDAPRLLRDVVGAPSEIERLESVIAELQKSVDTLTQDADESKQTIGELRDRLRHSVVSARQDVSDELERHRFDVLKVLVDLVEDIRRLAAPIDDSVPDIAARALATARRAGIVRLDEPGKIVLFVPSRYEPVENGSCDSSTEVEILEPAYGLVREEGADPLVLRKGRVRIPDR